MKLTIAVQAYSGALVQFQQGGFGSRHGEPAPEGSRLIAASGYESIAILTYTAITLLKSGSMRAKEKGAASAK